MLKIAEFASKTYTVHTVNNNITTNIFMKLIKLLYGQLVVKHPTFPF